MITKLVIPYIRMVALVEPSFYFDFGLGFACDNALAATDFVFVPVFPLRSNDDALLATLDDVCFGFDFATSSPPHSTTHVSLHANNGAKNIYIKPSSESLMCADCFETS